MKKYVKYLLPVVIVALLLLFYDSIICFSLEQYVNKNLPKNQKVLISYRSMQWKKNGLVFQNLEASSLQGKIQTKSVVVGVSNHSNWLKKKLQLQVVSPVVRLKKSEKSAKLLSVLGVSLKKLRFDVVDGIVFLEHDKPVYFSFDGYKGPKSAVTCHLSTSREKKQMHLSVKEKNEVKQVDALFTDLSLEELDPFVTKIKKLRGFVNGAFHFHLTKDGECEEFDYHLLMQDLAFSTRSAEYSFKKVTLCDSYEKMPPMKQFWNLLLTSTKVESGKVVLNQDLSEMHFDASFDIKEPMKIYGYWLTDDETHPFSFSGGGNRDYQSSWNVLLENQTGGSFRLTGNKQGYLFFQTFLKGLRPRHVHLFKSSLLPIFPEIESFDMAAGETDLHLNLWVDLQGIMRLEIENICCLNGSITYGDMAANFKRFEGSLYLNGPDFSVNDLTDWSARLDDGLVKINDVVYEEVDISLLMQQKFLLLSHLSGRKGLAKVHVGLEGLLNKLQISSSLELDKNVYTSKAVFLNEPKGQSLEGSLRAAYDNKTVDKLEFALALDTEKILSLFSNQLLVDSEKIEPSTQKNETVSQTKNQKETGFLSYFKKGSFQGKNLHQDSFNLPICLSGVSWRGNGILDINGRMDENQLEIRVCSNKCGFTSSYVNLDYPENSERISGSFHYNRKTKKWEGFVPLKDAVCIEPRFNLLFEEVKGNLIVSGNKINIKELEGVSDGLKLKGETSLTVLPDDEAEFYVHCPYFEGSSDSLVAFMNHFESYQSLSVPFNGQIEAKNNGLEFFVKIGKNTPPAKWSIDFYGYEGTFSLLENVKAEHVSLFLSWNSEEKKLKIKDLFGGLCLFGEQEVREYQLNGKEILLFDDGKLSFDVRIENHTHDIFKFLGSLDKQEEGYALSLDKDHTHLFGSKLKESSLLLSNDYSLQESKLKLEVSSYDILNHLDFFQSAGLLGIKRSIIEDLGKNRIEGAIEVGFSFSKEKDHVSLTLQSNELLHNGSFLGPVEITFLRDGNKLFIPKCQVGKVSFVGEFLKNENSWDIPYFNLSYKDSFLQAKAGKLSLEKEKVDFSIKKAGLDLEECKRFFSADFSDYLEGLVSFDGNVSVDFSESSRNLRLLSDLSFYCDELGSGKIKLKSTAPFHLEVIPSDNAMLGIKVTGGAIKLSKGKNWSECSFGTLLYKEGKLEGKSFSGILPPEMCLYLAESDMLPFVSYQEDKLLVWGTPVKWENQIESKFDFTYGKNEKKINGCITDGYYWIGDKSWKIDHFTYSYDNDMFEVRLNSQVFETPLAFGASLKLGPTMTAEAFLKDLSEDEVVSKETSLNDSSNDQKNDAKSSEKTSGLSLDKDWKDQALTLQMYIRKDGISIQSLEGSIFGLDFFFHRNQKRTLPNEMQITGQLKIDPTKLQKALPKEFSEAIAPLELGKGYELSGDLVLSREKFKQSYFKGYLKGRHFVFMGSHLKTLLSDVTIESGLLRFDDFKVADEAGFISIKEILFSKDEKSDWNIHIPELEIQDFRPSMLKKIDQYRGKVKPLKICQLKLHNLQGKIGDGASFVGDGAFRFTNTFKTDFNLFDIPFEIIGRLGLDMGLLVPACGNIDFSIKEGRLYFDALDESYSEGKRSRFYLSKKRASFIDFAGNMDVNIKMKQYVLLKITEPFTIAIEGSLADPKYSLK